MAKGYARERYFVIFKKISIIKCNNLNSLFREIFRSKSDMKIRKALRPASSLRADERNFFFRLDRIANHQFHDAEKLIAASEKNRYATLPTRGS